MASPMIVGRCTQVYESSFRVHKGAPFLFIRWQVLLGRYDYEMESFNLGFVSGDDSHVGYDGIFQWAFLINGKE